MIADQEGALISERGLVWSERNSIEKKEKPEGTHAYVVERHHEILRDRIHKIKDQLALEGLNVPLSIIVAEATLAKNVLLNVHGESPYRAVFGRAPAMLREFEDSTLAATDDFEGTPRAGIRAAARVREVAMQQMIEGCS